MTKIKEDDDIRDGFFDDLFKKYKKNKKVYFLTADQGALKLKDFIKHDHRRVINVGISEQLLVSFASGLSGSGNIVYIYAISSFLIFRAFEQIKVDLILNKSNVKIIGMGTGFCYSQDGPTHHSLEDISVLRPYLNVMNIYTPSNSISSSLISQKIYRNKGLDYVRLDKGKYKYENLYKKNKHLENLFIYKEDNYSKCIISYGVLINFVFRMYNKEKIQIIDFYKLNLNTNKAIDYLTRFKKIIVIEENIVCSSLGSIIENYLANTGIKVKKIGVKGISNYKYGSREYMINQYIFNRKNKKLIKDFIQS